MSENKMLEIVESYINGNISWVKSEVKKYPKNDRKELYNFSLQYPNCSPFFFSLI